MIIAVDARGATTGEAEHLIMDALDVIGEAAPLTCPASTWLAGQVAAGQVLACTHVVREPVPHYAVTIEAPASRVPDEVLVGLTRRWPTGACVCLDGAGSSVRRGTQASPAVCRGAELAADEAARRVRGRAVVFPGAGVLRGVLTVAEILERSLLDAVVAVGLGRPASPSETVDTLGFVRPQRLDGQWVWHVRPASATDFVPFEVPNPTPCCAAHAARATSSPHALSPTQSLRASP